jgi:hypothetical protein
VDKRDEALWSTVAGAKVRNRLVPKEPLKNPRSFHQTPSQNNFKKKEGILSAQCEGRHASDAGARVPSVMESCIPSGGISRKDAGRPLDLLLSTNSPKALKVQIRPLCDSWAKTNSGRDRLKQLTPQEEGSMPVPAAAAGWSDGESTLLLYHDTCRKHQLHTARPAFWSCPASGTWLTAAREIERTFANCFFLVK